MNDYGSIIRNIRNGKGLTLKDVTGNGVSLPQLSRFERGKSSLSLDKLFIVLENMGVSVEEFEYAARGYRLNPFDQLLKEAMGLFNDENIHGLRKMVNDQKKKTPGKEVLRHKLTVILIKNKLAEIDEQTKLREEEKKQVVNYLIQVNEWTHYELILYANTMSTFSTDDLVDLTQDILSRTVYYQEIQRNRQLVTGIVLNSIIILLDRKEVQQAHRFKKILHFKQIDEESLFDKNLLLFAMGALEFYEDQEKDGKKKMEQAIEIFNTLKSYHLSRRYQAGYNQIVKDDEVLLIKNTI